MAIATSLDTLSAGQKEELIASLAVLLVGSNGNKAAAAPEPEGDDEEGADESAGPVTMSMESIQAVASAAGCTVSASVAKLFAQIATVVPGGVAAYCMSPGGGGGGSGGGGGGASGSDGAGAAAAEAKPEEKEEEEEMDLGGGMDMFGGDDGGGGGGDY